METDKLLQEISFKTVRSSGAGGQHVNKVESKVILIWDVDNSTCFSIEQKKQIKEKLFNRLSKEGVLQLGDSGSRSQFSNKESVTLRFINLIENALKPTKKRISTKIPKSKVLQRLDRKKRQSQKKQQRRNFGFE